MWTLASAFLFVMAFIANLHTEPIPNSEFDRLLALASHGNLTAAADIPQYAPYNRTLLDIYLQNPGKYLAYFVLSILFIRSILQTNNLKYTKF